MLLERYGTRTQASAPVDILRLKASGFVEVTEPDAAPDEPLSREDLQAKSKAELIELAKLAGYESGLSNMNKDDLVDLLLEDEDKDED